MKKEEEKSYEIAVAKDLSSRVVGPSPSGRVLTPMYNDLAIVTTPSVYKGSS